MNLSIILYKHRVQVSGTYCGNTFAIAMVLAVQNYVTEDRQASLEAISRHIHDACKQIIADTKIPAVVDFIGNKGCITFFKKDVVVEPVKHYQHYIQNVDLVVETLFAFFCFNRGMWVQPRDEWSISYQHSMDDASKFIEAFREFADLIKDRYV